MDLLLQRATFLYTRYEDNSYIPLVVWSKLYYLYPPNVQIANLICQMPYKDHPDHFTDLYLWMQDNGVLALVITVALFMAGWRYEHFSPFLCVWLLYTVLQALVHNSHDLNDVFCRLNWFQPGRVYDVLGELLSVLNIFGIGLCVLLTIKVRYFRKVYSTICSLRHLCNPWTWVEWIPLVFSSGWYCCCALCGLFQDSSAIVVAVSGW